MGRVEYNTIIKYNIKAQTNSPLHIGGYLGGKDEILIHSVTETPFVQASSLAGLLRSISSDINGKSVTDELFGASEHFENSDSNDQSSRVRISDGTIDASTIILEKRPNIAVDKKTGTVNNSYGSGQKFDMTYISEGAKFEFDVFLFLSDISYQNHFERILSFLCKSGGNLGAKKSSGAGRFVVSRIHQTVFDMTDETDRKAWISNDDSIKGYTDITDEVLTKIQVEDNSIAYNISVVAKTEGPLQIKGIAVNEFGKDAPDSENIRNGRGDYIIPGTSLRGAIRGQMEKIASYMGKNQVINNAFGFVAENQSDSKMGNLVFGDSVIGKTENNSNNPIRNRIHIDKFTGGVISQGLFKEKNVIGDIEIDIQIKEKYNPDATLGLLIYAIRDLALKTYNLGNGYATGKGFLDISNIVITKGAATAEIQFLSDNEKIQINDETGIITNALNALKEVQA